MLLLALVVAACGDGGAPSGRETVDATVAGSARTSPADTQPEDTVETMPEDAEPDESVPDESVPEESVPEESVPEESVPAVTAPEGGGDAGESGMEGVIEQAVADLAERLDVGPDVVDVLSAVSVVWPDAGMGCPVPGMSYAQVQVDGARIELSVDGIVYAYHVGGGRPPFLCAGGRPADLPGS